MIYLPGLLVVCAAFWFALSGEASLSGETSWLFLIWAGVAVAVGIAAAARLRTIDREGSPYHHLASLAGYFAWLLVEIVKANAAVIGAVLNPRRSINPAVVRIPTSDRSGVARALFANSITLTPGTVTLDVGPDWLLVHALNEEAAQPGDFATMDRLSRRAVDGGERSGGGS